MTSDFDFLAATACARCGGGLASSTMSRFSTETICISCSVRERAHPAYAKAEAEELAAVQHGDMNYPGIGSAHCPELYGPPCLAEQLVLAVAGQPQTAWPPLVVDLGGVLGNDDASFPDGSAAAWGRGRLTVLYPPIPVAGQRPKP